MTVDTLDKLVSGLTADAADRIYIEKASLANTVAGRLHSLWRATGQPAQGAIPSTAALCTSALLGAVQFTNSVAPVYNYLPYFTCANSVGVAALEVWDRLAHMGGLSGTTAGSPQTVGLDLSSAGVNVPADRRGASNYSDIQWYLEVYSDLGSTAVTATIAVTLNDDSTTTLSLSIPATLRAGALLGLTGVIPVANQGKFIKSIQSVTLSATTGTAGSFGFTAYRTRAVMPMAVANVMTVLDWAQTGMPDIPNNSCLTLVVLPTTTSGTGALHGTGKIIHG